MTSPENTHPDQNKFTVAGVDVQPYDPNATTNVPDGHDSLTLPDTAPTFTQPEVSFPVYTEKGKLHNDGVPHTEQLAAEAEVALDDLGLPKDVNPGLVALATQAPETIDTSLGYDSDQEGKAMLADVFAPRIPHAQSEIEDAMLELRKRDEKLKIIPALGSAALTWLAIKFGVPTGDMETAKNTMAWVASPIVGGLHYALSIAPGVSPQKHQKLAQKAVKKLQKQEQQRRAES